LDRNKYLRVGIHILEEAIFDTRRFFALVHAYKELLILIFLVLCGICFNIYFAWKLIQSLFQRLMGGKKEKNDELRGKQKKD
jgi:hypothetical protein